MHKCISLSVSVVVLCVGGWLFANAQSAVNQAVNSEPQAQTDGAAEAASIVEADPTTKDAAAKADEAQKPAPEYRYSLGILISDVPDILRAHTAIPEDEGVLVQNVNEDSPAAKAGLKSYDILLKIDGEPIKDTAALQQAVQKSEGKEIALTILAKGQTKEVKITPDKIELPQATLWGRPAYHFPQNTQQPYNPGSAEDYQDEWYQRAMEWQQRQFEEMRQRMDALEQAMPGFGALRAPRRNGAAPFRQPAFRIQQGANVAGQSSSESFSYSVEKVNDQPAKIHINDNGKEYTVDENSLDQLPEEIRNKINFQVSGEDNAVQIQIGKPEATQKAEAKSGKKADKKAEEKKDKAESDSSSDVEIKGVIDLKQ